MPRLDPWEIDEWHFVRQEAMLVRQLLGSGVTALGHANYADKKGEYYTAFFGLSVGLERLCKLILIVNQAISERVVPGQEAIRGYGHDIKALIDAIDDIAEYRGLSPRFRRPDDTVAVAIIDNLHAFSDARKGRYANFMALGDPNLTEHEPLKKWWDEVAETVLQQRYYGTKMQARVEAHARAISQSFGQWLSVNHTTEGRERLTNVELASTRTGQTAVIQKWSRYHSLTIVRWLSSVYNELAQEAVYQADLDAFFGSWEFFQTYTVDDEFLKTRKIWPLG